MSRSVLPCLVLLLALPCSAQEPLITVDPLPEEVRVGQVYTIAWTSHDPDIELIEPTDFPGFTKLSGPSQQSETHYLNSRKTYRSSLSYDLRVEQAGTIQIPTVEGTMHGSMITCTSTPVLSLAAGASSDKPDAMSQALLHQVTPNGTISAHVHGDGAYITQRHGKDEEVLRFLTAKEARALGKHLRRLAGK